MGAGAHTSPRRRRRTLPSAWRSMLGLVDRMGAAQGPHDRSRNLRGDPMPPTGNTPALTETPAAPTPARRPATDRLVFLDALRGFALIFMVLNHTGRWWQDRSMGWPWYYSIYVTMAVAAPTFLFLVGYCLPLSLVKTRGAAVEQVLPPSGSTQARRAHHPGRPSPERARLPRRPVLEQRRSADDRPRHHHRGAGRTLRATVSGRYRGRGRRRAPLSYRSAGPLTSSRDG